LTMVQGSCRMYIERYIMDNEQLHQESADSTNLLYSTVQLKRIADALEEVLRLVKEDQERSRKYMEDRKDD